MDFSTTYNIYHSINWYRRSTGIKMYIRHASCTCRHIVCKLVNMFLVTVVLIYLIYLEVRKGEMAWRISYPRCKLPHAIFLGKVLILFIENKVL